ncbi:MAG: MAPEG family protein [Steroidobacteraceae bacterium]
MAWVQLVTLLAGVQFLWLGLLVARARMRYGVVAPATAGNEMFERYHRVHMNTLETLVVFLPALWIAAQYWSPRWMAALGAIYLVGRMLYLQGYVADPKGRHIGYAVTVLPVIALILIGLYGAIGTLLLR